MRWPAYRSQSVIDDLHDVCFQLVRIFWISCQRCILQDDKSDCALSLDRIFNADDGDF